MGKFSEFYNYVCSRIQIAEVIAKQLYSKYLSNRVNPDVVNNPQRFIEPELIKFEDLKKHLLNLGIKNGDILLVHSSMRSFKGMDATVDEFLDFLISLVGDKGTICFPCFPLYDDKNIKKKDGQNIRVYNKKTTKCWTGYITNLFLKKPGVIRSAFPNNPLAALGPEAETMMAHAELQQYPHGKNSAWEYFVNRKAKILYLGCNVAHSQTIIHVREDLHPEKWPIKDWYDEIEYFLEDSGEFKTIKERKLEWAQYYTGAFSVRQLTKKGFYISVPFNGIPITFCPDAKALTSYLFEQDVFKNINWLLPKKLSKPL